jgi:arylsulfatase A-like enzyme
MIREELERQGLAQNTVIIFTSDNGYNRGSHGFGDKVIPYEEGSKAPLIIYDPRLPKQHAGRTSAAVTANVDLPATIFAFSGVDAPEGLDGRNLLPLLENPTGRVREWLPLFNFWGVASAQSMAVVSAEWKYIHWYYGGPKAPENPETMTPTEELFNLTQDGGEMMNLAGDQRHASQLAAARTVYDSELSVMKASIFPGHGYQPYPVLFDRSTPWAEKEPLLKGMKQAEAKAPAQPAKKKPKKEKAQQ